MNSQLIKDISVYNEDSWRNKFFISTDIDWASDDIINYCINFFSNLDVKVTWFSTHKTQCNTEIKKNKLFDKPHKNNSINTIFTSCLKN